MSSDVSFGKAPFVIKSEEKYSLVTLSGDLDGNVEKEFEKKVAGLLAANKHIFFDFKECTGVHPIWARTFLMLARELKKATKEIRLISVSGDIQRAFVDLGIGQTIKYSVSVENALIDIESGGAPSASGAGAKKVDAKFINAFLDAAIKVLKIQAQTDLKAGAPFLKEPRAAFAGDISGVIGLVSDAFNGSIVINFPEATFLGVISRMLGEKYEKLTPEISDGAGELTNIIFGQAKVTLNEIGYGIKMATPTVVVGKNHQISSVTTGPRITVPFTCDLGSFTIEICLA